MMRRIKDSRIARNNKGVVLLFSFFMMLILLGISAAFVMYSINVGKLNQRNDSSLQAFYEAEAGISYAYAEESPRNFNWYTHEDKNTPVTTSHVVTKGPITITFEPPVPPFVTAGASIDPVTGCYSISGRNFSVKTYPEQIRNESTGQDEYTGIIVVHSQATVNGITGSLEYRLGRASVYQYFFFFPTDTAFSGGTYDGRNYGGIHVNGDILFRSNTYFYFLTALTCSSLTSGKGFMRAPLSSLYSNLATTSNGETTYSGLSGAMCYNSQYHFYQPTIRFRFGTIPTGYTTKDLSYSLDNSQYSGAEWNYKKYTGTSTTPLHYVISNTNLKSQAEYELTHWSGSAGKNLLDQSKVVEVTGMDPGTETDIFKQLWNTATATVAQWNDFWSDWKSNHQNDYQSYHNSGTLIGGEDWERRFYIAGYDWNMSATGVPNNGSYGVNREWWEDLRYGDDRTGIDYMAAARVENNSTGLGSSNYYLNTEQQSSAWGKWLAANKLDATGQNKTLVQDKSQGASYVDTGKVLGTAPDQNVVKKKALNGGIYIGLDEDGKFQNPISDCTTEKQFYNVAQPAAKDSSYSGYYKYKPSSVLKIDVACLKAKIDSAKIDSDKAYNGPLKDFNGIIYTDLTGYNWSNAHYDNNADGVMLINGARLPEGGLSLGTPNNVFIKGDYNLDPDGVSEKNRSPDDPTVTGRYTSVDLEWQPAEIVTQRVVYTLSNNFPESSYMPMDGNYGSQYYDEDRYVTGQDFVNHPSYPTNFGTNTWVPAASKTTTTRLNNWFTYYSGGSVALPGNWTQSWVDANWPSGKTFAIDTNADSNPDIYIAANDLRTDAQSQIASGYSSNFGYTAVHGADGSLNPDTPSGINVVNQKYIYNAAIITPNSTTPSVLEYWNNPDRVINGAFILLPEGGLALPKSVAYGRTRNPNNIFNYESRFGRGSNERERPRLDLTFSANSSWREINNADF
jgi:hypothetical protein